MKYADHYDRLITRARGRTLVGYRERHHVVPRCMGGDNSSQNLVYLTGEEHYVAHQLLVKMHPKVRGLAVAAVRMAKQCTGNKAYGWLRRRIAKETSDRFRGKKCAPFSPEHRARMSLVKRGNRHAAGHIRSPEHRAKLSAAMKGNHNGLGVTPSPEKKERLSISQRGRIFSPEHRSKLCAARRARPPHSPETRAKMSAAHRKAA